MMKKILFLVAVVFLGLGFTMANVLASFKDCSDAGGDYCSKNSTCTSPDTKVMDGYSGQCAYETGSTTYACCKNATSTATTTVDTCPGKPDDTECFYKGDSSKIGSCTNGTCWYFDATITTTQISSPATCTVGQACKVGTNGGAGTCQNADATFSSYGYKTMCVLNGYDASGNAVSTSGNVCSGTCARSGICPSGLSPNSDTCSGGGTCCASGGGNTSGTGSSNIDCPATDSSCAGKSMGDDCTKDGSTGECAGRGCDEAKLYCLASASNSITPSSSSSCPATESICAGKSMGDDCTKDGSTGECAGRGCDETKLYCFISSAISGSPYESDAPASGTPMFNVEELAGFGLPDATVSGIIEGIVMWLLGIFGFLGIIAFVVSGIYYLTAAGDAEQEKKAKLVMKMAIMGIVVGLMGFVVIKTIDTLLDAGRQL